MRRRSLAMILLSFMGGPVSAADYKYIASDWLHELGITRLAGYGDGEFLVLSEIIQQRPIPTVRHHLEVKISALGKTFTAASESTDRKRRESLAILLRASPDPKQFKVAFDHMVFEDGVRTLRFSGVTFLPRW
jgi:hypothetical protein